MTTNRWEGIKWKDEEIKTLKRYFSNIENLQTLSLILNRSVGSIRAKAQNMGLKRNFKTIKRGWKLSNKTKEKMSKTHIGELNPNWKGDVKNIKSIATLHEYIARRKKKPLFCQICGKKKKLELANIKGHKYTRNPDDYMWLCRSCHTKLDESLGFRKRNKIGRFTK